MKKYIAIVSISGETVTKYQDFDNEDDAKAHVETHGGFSQESVGDSISYYKVADGKATYDSERLKSDQATEAANAYVGKRKDEYPSIEDQLDKIYHDGIDEWKKVIKAVKDKYPK